MFEIIFIYFSTINIWFETAAWVKRLSIRLCQNELKNAGRYCKTIIIYFINISGILRISKEQTNGTSESTNSGTILESNNGNYHLFDKYFMLSNTRGHIQRCSFQC